MTAETPTVIELDSVTKTYRKGGAFRGDAKSEVVALDRITFCIRRGEIFGLVGESGSGKTTVGRLLLKLEEPDQGRLTVEGENLSAIRGPALRQFRRRAQMIFQDPYQSLNPYMSVYHTVGEPVIIHRLVQPNQRRKKVVEALAEVGLTPPEDFLPRYPHQLSGGQRQRVAIARATILSPAFIVADEPTSMLDASISVQIFNILVQLREKLSATLLFITHSLAAARYLCDRIAVIRRGEIVESGPTAQIIRDPQHPYTRELILAQPRFRRNAAGTERL